MNASNLMNRLQGALLAGALTVGAPVPTGAQGPAGTAGAPSSLRNMANDPDFYVGMWVTRDGEIRHELLRGGRYDEARGNRKSAYRGRYALKGDHIDYIDDTGFTADGQFRDGVLYHGGMVLYREPGK